MAKQGSGGAGAPTPPVVSTSQVEPGEIEALTRALLGSDLQGTIEIAQLLQKRGLSLEELYTDLIQPAMYEIGDMWREGEIDVGQEHLATATAHRLLGMLYEPAGQPSAGDRRPRVLLACVEGERHALGLQMLADSLDRRDLQVMNMGPDVPTEALLRAARQLEPDVVCLSLSTRLQLPTLHAVILALRRDVRVAIGGQGVPPSLREAAPWVCSVKELPRIDVLPFPAEVLASLEKHIPDVGSSVLAEESAAGEAAVEQARIEAEERRALVWRGSTETP